MTPAPLPDYKIIGYQEVRKLEVEKKCVSFRYEVRLERGISGEVPLIIYAQWFGDDGLTDIDAQAEDEMMESIFASLNFRGVSKEDFFNFIEQTLE